MHTTTTIIDPGTESGIKITELTYIGPPMDEDFMARVRGRIHWLGADFVFVREGDDYDIRLLDAEGADMEIIQHDSLDHEYYESGDGTVRVAVEAADGAIGHLSFVLGKMESRADRAARYAYEAEWRSAIAEELYVK